ncbi:hypothetical protein V6N13_094476 [Hibiscus sabdariffa]
MATVCSTDNVKERCQRRGLEELTVKSLGGQNFLIEIPEEELVKLLEEQNRSLLEEAFVKVEHWSESFKLPERAKREAQRFGRHFSQS